MHVMPRPSITLYATPLSGHCHRVALLLRMLDLPYRVVEAPHDVRQGPAFLALNPLGQIPVLQDGGRILADSNAILVYLATRYDADRTWLPEDPDGAAQVQRWLSIAAGEVKYGPATARAIALWKLPGDPVSAEAITMRLMRFMDGHLAERRFLAAPHPTIGDVACYSYVAHAPEGGISLDAYQAVLAWLKRVEALARFQPMPRSPALSAASD